MKNLTLIIFFIASCLSALAYATDSASQIFSKVKSSALSLPSDGCALDVRSYIMDAENCLKDENNLPTEKFMNYYDDIITLSQTLSPSNETTTFQKVLKDVRVDLARLSAAVKSDANGMLVSGVLVGSLIAGSAFMMI